MKEENKDKLNEAAENYVNENYTGDTEANKKLASRDFKAGHEHRDELAEKEIESLKSLCEEAIGVAEEANNQKKIYENNSAKLFKQLQFRDEQDGWVSVEESGMPKITNDKFIDYICYDSERDFTFIAPFNGQFFAYFGEQPQATTHYKLAPSPPQIKEKGREKE